VSKEQFVTVEYSIHDEGMDYTFDTYSEWDDIVDEHFHVLRKRYLEAMNALKTYVLAKSAE
jgi:hypothetical protein